MIVDSPLFRTCPALVALKDVQMPNPEHIRACLLELAKLAAQLADQSATIPQAAAEETDKVAMWALFHRLWGKGKDSPDYNKQEWIELERFIFLFLRQGKEATNR